ncbi:hypothetical protein [Catellatospora chokoriensis]|uniref:hypothetical protein n=1 Tax=Catellatospora chokoriensis TaxID=310353 RepID=UPI001781F0CC|nr:hypothetical protein [Catellatospora chokoriensis]
MSRLWTRFGSYVLAGAGIAGNLLTVFLVFELVPEDGNLPPGIVVMAFWSVQLAVLHTFSSVSAVMRARGEPGEGGDRRRSGSSGGDMWPVVKQALKEHRLGFYSMIPLVLLAFAIFAVAAPCGWFEVPWREGGRSVFPPSAVIPVDVAVDVLGRYCATGELSGMAKGSGR